MMSEFQLQHNLVDIREKRVIATQLTINNGKITKIEEINKPCEGYILPGFIDAHIHIESSMLTPSYFAREALVHGTVATVSDPHEIANVLGLAGVEYMIDDAKQVPLKFNFGAPSCVPATPFETSGAELDAKDVESLMARPEIKYLSEMMNWPGVLNRDALVMDKIKAAEKYNKPVDGHAPGLKGDQAKNYIDAGISTDHECFTAEEAKDKLKHSMKILIREGSAAKNYAALSPLIEEYANNMMFCSDDKHPDDLLQGHINLLVKRALSEGYNMYDVLQMACVNPIEHYKLDVGQLRVDDPADFIVVNNLTDFSVLQTYVDGELVAEKGEYLGAKATSKIVNNFNRSETNPTDFDIPANGKAVRVIEALDGELITRELEAELKAANGNWQADLANDVLPITVVNRYQDAKPAMGFIKNFGLKKGAIASSVGHDSHNITAVGVDCDSLAKAVNGVIRHQGGLAVYDGKKTHVLPLPVAGLMSNLPAEQIGNEYAQLSKLAKDLGSELHAPFMTLSFMALLVIPQLKLSDLGLFDGSTFQFVDLEK